MRSRFAEILRTFFYNVLVFFVVVNILYWSIPAYTSISGLFRKDAGGIKSVYKSFVEWGAPGAQRRTVNDNTEGSRKVYFFGGSTMWEVGSEDPMTIPSQFAAITKIHSENFAVPGYTAHQSLITLLHLLQEGHRPDLVVFYDGVNDVWAKCRREHDANSHGWEREYKSILSSPPDSFSYYFRAITRLAIKIRGEISQSYGDGVYDCGSDGAKSEAIAQNIIRDWQFASQLGTPYGVKFMAILQPVAYFTGSAAGRFKVKRNLESQYKAVYPLIRQKITPGGEVHDLVSVLDTDESVYTDFAHINGTGNGYVARKIAELAAPLGFGR